MNRRLFLRNGSLAGLAVSTLSLGACSRENTKDQPADAAGATGAGAPAPTDESIP